MQLYQLSQNYVELATVWVAKGVINCIMIENQQFNTNGTTIIIYIGTSTL